MSVGHVQANWFLDGLVTDESDPFASVAIQEELRVEDVGTAIDLRDLGELERLLLELVQAESALFNRNVSCSIKDRDDTSCHACPVRETDERVPLAALCMVGRKQECVATEMAVHRERQALQRRRAS